MEADGGLSDGVVEKESQRPASGAMAFNSASPISLVLTFWKGKILNCRSNGVGKLVPFEMREVK